MKKLFLEGQRAETLAGCAVGLSAEARCAAHRLPDGATKQTAQKLKKQIDGFFTSKEGPDFKRPSMRGKRSKASSHQLRPETSRADLCLAYKELQNAELPDLFVIIGTASAGWTMSCRDG